MINTQLTKYIVNEGDDIRTKKPHTLQGLILINYSL